MYLRLLVTRQGIHRVLKDAPRSPDRAARRCPAPRMPRSSISVAPNLKRRLEDPGIADELRRSLTSQLELVEQRLVRRGEADQKLAFLDAEIARIEEQVELIREQAVLSSDPEHFSSRIDEIGATLGSTGQWIADQQQTLGAMDDLIAEPPPLAMQTRARETQ